MADEPEYLVCARADADYTTPGSNFERTCGGCNTRVQIAVSGQRRLRGEPWLRIMCADCFLKRGSPKDQIRLAGSRAEVLQEILSRQPNFWKHRN